MYVFNYRVQDRKTVPISYVFTMLADSNLTLSTSPQDLIIFIPDENEVENHLTQFKNVFNKRQRTNREYWLLDISYGNSVQEVKSDLKNIDLDLDDDLYWYKSSGENIDLYEVYRIHKDFDIKILPFGNWTAVSNNLILPNLEKWTRRSNLEGANFRVVSLVSNPYITEMIPIGPDRFTMKGMFAEVFFALQSVLNFTFTLTKSPDGQWGALQTDGSWTGMVRELQDKRADIGKNQGIIYLFKILCI